MKITVLYHPLSDHARVCEEFMHDVLRQNPTAACELVSLEDRAGADLAELYGIVSYPVILARQDDGSLSKYWEGVPLPLQGEVLAYTYS
ncbi:MAG: hypothetical protein AAB459_03780 [Patescibacteria group bacterium]|jgi:hypothetical protein